MEEAKAHIFKKKVWRQAQQRDTFLEVYGAHPQQLKGLGARFREAEKAQKVRNAIIHGNRGASPQDFQKLTLALLELLEADWQGPLKELLKAQGRSTRYCDPLSRIQASKAEKN